MAATSPLRRAVRVLQGCMDGFEQCEQDVRRTRGMGAPDCSARLSGGRQALSTLLGHITATQGDD